MSGDLIKLNQGIEGADVRDAMQWIKRITGAGINRMKIGKTGLLFSFVDRKDVIAGKVFIPSTGELWKSEKEVGFNGKRLHNAFSIFKRRDKTELYIKQDKLFLKNGALKWRYNMEDIEEAAKIDLSKIPTPGITIRLEDVLDLKQVNKGKKSEKLDVVAFKYGSGKAAIFVTDNAGKNRVEICEVVTEGEGEGVALYNLIQLEKLLKDAKGGLVRIEEEKPLKLNIRTGRKTKAVLYLAPLRAPDLTEELKGETSSPTEEPKPKEEKLKSDIKDDEEKLGQIEEEEGEEVIFASKAPEIEEEIRQKKAELKAKGAYKEAVYEGRLVYVYYFNALSNSDEAIYRDTEGREYLTGDLNFDLSDIEHARADYLERINKAATAAAEQIEEEKKVKAELDRIQEHEKREQEKYKGVREEVIKEGVTFLTVREATGAKFHSSGEVYEDMKAEAKIDRECIWALHLNNQNKVIEKELVAMGTGNAAMIAGRDLYRRAIIEGTTSIIMIHNHPGGDPAPSESDKDICSRLREAGKLLGIKLLDFMVIAAGGYYSFADEGALDSGV